MLSVNRDSGEFSTLLAALETVGLTSSLFDSGVRTVFAPTDAAFAELDLNADTIRDLDPGALEGILLYHMTKGSLEASEVVATKQIRMLNNAFAGIALKDGDAFIDNAMIIQTDIMASNGVIHVIDGVLLPRIDNSIGGQGYTRDITWARPTQPSIYDVAAAVNAETGEFSTLIAALKITELVDALNGSTRLTVFAPTDAAFAGLGLDASNIGDLGVDGLTEILLYHVSEGSRLAAEVLTLEQIRMLNNEFTQISLVDGAAFIDDARIIQTDVGARNGVIHIIDSVLLPGQDEAFTGTTRERTSSS